MGLLPRALPSSFIPTLIHTHISMPNVSYRFRCLLGRSAALLHQVSAVGSIVASVMLYHFYYNSGQYLKLFYLKPDIFIFPQFWILMVSALLQFLMALLFSKLPYNPYLVQSFCCIPKFFFRLRKCFPGCSMITAIFIPVYLFALVLNILIFAQALLIVGSPMLNPFMLVTKTFHSEDTRASLDKQERIFLFPKIRDQKPALVSDYTELVHQFQLQYKCCGGSGWKDWSSYGSSNKLDSFVRTMLGTIVPGGVPEFSIEVPASCCNPLRGVHCNFKNAEIAIRTGTSLYIRGCNWIFLKEVMLFLAGISGILLLCFFFTSMAFVFGRISATAAMRAWKAHAPEGDALGYLFRAPPAFIHKKKKSCIKCRRCCRKFCGPIVKCCSMCGLISHSKKEPES